MTRQPAAGGLRSAFNIGRTQSIDTSNRLQVILGARSSSRKSRSGSPFRRLDELDAGLQFDPKWRHAEELLTGRLPERYRWEEQQETGAARAAESTRARRQREHQRSSRGH